MILDVPDGKEPITWVWGELVPGIGPAAARFSQAVYTHTTLGLREFEAARLRVAQINGCLFCQDWRTERDGAVVEDGFDTAVEQWRTTDAFDDRYYGWDPARFPSRRAHNLVRARGQLAHARAVRAARADALAVVGA